MEKPALSDHFMERVPSDVRVARLAFSDRKDSTKAINLAVGNVSLPMHPSMIGRMKSLGAKDSPFKDGVVRYSETPGFEETNQAFLNIIASSGFDTAGLYSQITDGASHAMELVTLGTSGRIGGTDRPLLLIDPAYTNYPSMAQRTGRRIVAVSRRLEKDGRFSLPPISEIEALIKKENPSAMVVIPYDNPTGHFYDLETMLSLGRLCVEHNLWMISDEAYRELFYTDNEPVSIWALTNSQIDGIEGRRISLETASKVWNACGLRIGALVTDNELFHKKCVAEQTANLCAPVLDQYIFGALAHESHKSLREWYSSQKKHYQSQLSIFTSSLKQLLPGVIVSSPDSSIYSVIDVRDIAKNGFDARSFVLYCAKEGKVSIGGSDLTLLAAPMEGFYNPARGQPNPGKSQMRIAYVESPQNMELAPKLFAELFRQYESKR